ncbi:hypothetical protein BURC_03964 [Burkholderiaceae bacterium]|nr:hypothetical protein BURC_03964 [Burkholderiaceae bacterium]
MSDSVQETLQIVGWLLTLIGQIQMAFKLRQGFATWVAANLVLVALSAVAGLWWSIGMYTTNTLVCIWSYRKWGQESQTMRPLFVSRATR